ncbi:hypothetical protein FNV43_RR13175 [Rhamnella rubrinervis]|uniref:Uncharacterized protein n=1 Tax=Rhamnella rubrinervis TaxID=2594499 RepID=A0A8K0H0K5_9ROSA|nr:hypothetical protein FNV43_RR13175 [Rhamnella rubrinervis]
MEKLTMKTQLPSFFIWTLLAVLLSPNLLFHVQSSTSFEDQKNYYSPDPHSGTPPTGAGTPSHSTPSHGTPSHGGGGSYNPTPSTPSYPTPSDPTPPSTPSTPSGKTVEPRHHITVEEATITTLHLQEVLLEESPGSDMGSSRVVGTLGHAFGVTSVPGFGSNFNLQQALSNSRTDGLGELYREGTASLLNSMVYSQFPFTTKQVRDHFVDALGSNNAAAAQARVFKLANEGRLKSRT